MRFHNSQMGCSSACGLRPQGGHKTSFGSSQQPFRTCFLKEQKWLKLHSLILHDYPHPQWRADKSSSGSTMGLAVDPQSLFMVCVCVMAQKQLNATDLLHSTGGITE